VFYKQPMAAIFYLHIIKHQ